MAMDADIKKMSLFASGLIVLAIVSVIGIVILAQFKTSLVSTTARDNCTSNPSCSGLQINSTIDLFIAGIAVFGTFATILALILIAKIILSMLKGGLD